MFRVSIRFKSAINSIALSLSFQSLPEDLPLRGSRPRQYVIYKVVEPYIKVKYVVMPPNKGVKLGYSSANFCKTKYRQHTDTCIQLMC